jgi:hypothetical protein
MHLTIEACKFKVKIYNSRAFVSDWETFFSDSPSLSSLFQYVSIIFAAKHDFYIIVWLYQKNTTQL